MAEYGVGTFRGFGGSDERKHDGGHHHNRHNDHADAITIMPRFMVVPPVGRQEFLTLRRRYRRHGGTRVDHARTPQNPDRLTPEGVSRSAPGRPPNRSYTGLGSRARQ